MVTHLESNRRRLLEMSRLSITHSDSPSKPPDGNPRYKGPADMHIAHIAYHIETSTHLEPSSTSLGAEFKALSTLEGCCTQGGRKKSTGSWLIAVTSP